MIGAPGNQFVVLPDKCDPAFSFDFITMLAPSTRVNYRRERAGGNGGHRIFPLVLSGYSQNWVSRSGLAMPRRSADSGCASRRPTARMPDCC
jgi:hypothetical protein